MHGALLLPSVCKALRTEGKRSWVSQVHFVLRPTAPPPWLRTSAAAVRNHGSCRSVAGGVKTHDSRCCGERTVQHCVCASCPAASARSQQPSPPALLGGRAPNDSRMFPWRILLRSSCPHFFGRRPPSTQHKKRPAFRWPFFRGYELSADYSARSFRRRSSSSAS